jgi:hypothetical protein
LYLTLCCWYFTPFYDIILIMSNPEEQPTPERSPSIIKHAAIGGIGGFVLSIYTGYTTGNLPLASLNEDIVIGFCAVGGAIFGSGHAYFERRSQRQGQAQAAVARRVEALQNSVPGENTIQQGISELERFASSAAPGSR